MFKCYSDRFFPIKILDVCVWKGAAGYPHILVLEKINKSATDQKEVAHKYRH